MKIVLLITLFIILKVLLFFYRFPPPRIIKNNEDIVLSPAYGKIMKIEEKGDKIFMAIFLTFLDIHYQFYPISGKIVNITYDNNGKFELVNNLNKSRNNEKVIYQILSKHGIFEIFQIAGYFVRRISTFGKVDENVDSGETLGIIHFGSRVDILIPKENFKIMVKEGDYTQGPHTILGKYLK